MSYSGVIFDLDGVLCSTDQYHFQAWQQLARKLGIPFSQEDNHALRGVSRMECLEILLKKGGLVCSEKEKWALAEEKNRQYRELLQQMPASLLSSDVRSTLLLLRQKGCKLAVGSSSKNARLILDKIGLEAFFDAVVDGTSISRSKPHPEVFLKAAEQLALSPVQCLVVEDAQAGVEAACRGGFDCAVLGCAEKAKWQIQSLKELLKIC